VRRRNAAPVDRHSTSRTRLAAVTLLVLLSVAVLPVAVSGFGNGAPVATTVHTASAVWNRPVPADPRTSAQHEVAEAKLAAERAAQQARIAAAAKAAAAKAAAAKRAAIAQAARAKALAAARKRQQAATTGAVKGSTPGSGSFRGRNRMWYPALGISYSVSWFPCSRSRAPDNYVYRWGCAGSNNVYLMGHAWGKFSPLYRAYYSGRLSRGQLLVYADNSGRVHRYRLSWWRTYPPLTSASWAWASLSRSSATLQTCVGPNSSLRLFVRFVEV
jgi:hypothetical protein